MIHCINGIIPHAFSGESSGRLSLMGREACDLGIFEISKIAGTVLQDTDGQFVGLSAAEDIAFALENDCVAAGEMQRRVQEAALLVDMKSHLAKSPQDLSGGQKQRISMAGILVDDVEVLLFDEPLANLDPAAGKEAIELIDELHNKTGKTILIVEHRLEDVLHRPVDRIVVMDGGRIIADKKPDEILSSDILGKIGIREPLYLQALKFAGIEIDCEMAPAHSDTLRVDYLPLVEWDGQLAGDRGQGEGESKEGDREEGKRDDGLVVRELTYRYAENEKDAVNNVSFSVAPGECAALVGRNGSGKSTVAKCICGFVKPDAGFIGYAAQDLAGFSIMERAEMIGYVMQNPNQMISFPMVFDEAAFGLRARGKIESEVKEKTFEALNVCGLYPFRNWPVSALSYGQKKRLTVASILVLRPSFMILDEPTAGQDYRHYTEFMDFLLNLNRNLNISLLLITHDMHLMLEYTTQAVVLSDGVLVANRKSYEVLTDDAIIEKASLKRTSLYELALKAGLSDPRGFVGRYIAYAMQGRGL